MTNYSWNKVFPEIDGDFFYSGPLPGGEDFVGIVQISTHPKTGARFACVYIPAGWRGNKSQESLLVFGYPDEWIGEWSGPENGLNCVEVTQ